MKLVKTVGLAAVILAAAGLLSLGWLLFGRLVRPAGGAGQVYAVVPAAGDGAGLEQTVKGLLWLRDGELARFTVVIADDGLDETGRAVAAALLAGSRGVVLCPPNLPTWVDIPIVELLQDTFGAPAYLLNDAKACALVEWKLGAGRGTNNMIFLTMGTGMGSGIIAEGRLVSGACDMGGEIGHMRIEPDGPVGFGKHGSFSGFTSGGGIGRLASALALQALEQGAPYAFARDRQTASSLTAKRLADAAAAGDRDARRIFALVGEKLGKGVALLIDALNPEAVIIGSIFVRCEALLRPSMEQVLERECIPYSLAACRVLPAQTGEQLGDLASIMTALYGAGMEMPDRLA